MGRTSYAWSLLHSVSRRRPHELSDWAYRGWQYAQELTFDARLRYELQAQPGPKPPKLTIAELARRDDLSPSTISKMIKQARYELFGDLTDSALYKRRQRQRIQRAHNLNRHCAEPGCKTAIPIKAPRHRRYCDQHRSPAARTRRSRAMA